MSFNFPLIITVLLVVTGLVSLFDKLWFEPRRKKLSGDAAVMPKIAELARSFFSVFLIVYIVRAFVMQPFYTPTQSLEPTIMPGDFSFVTQYNYGLHLPVWNKTLISFGHPKRGDIVVFHWPVNTHVDFVKRVIGVPGDTISYINKVLYINGHKIKQKLVGHAMDNDGPGTTSWPVDIYQEDLDGVVHKIYRAPDRPAYDFRHLVVPKGYYFMMGDNRDNSDDSRDWGFVPMSDIMGKAQFLFMSWDPAKHRVRWNRIGNKL